jgi:hypothetical protein
MIFHLRLQMTYLLLQLLNLPMLVPILHDKPFKGGEAEYISDLVRFGLF